MHQDIHNDVPLTRDEGDGGEGTEGTLPRLIVRLILQMDTDPGFEGGNEGGELKVNDGENVDCSLTSDSKGEGAEEGSELEVE